jgi:hypothetical protein
MRTFTLLRCREPIETHSEPTGLWRPDGSMGNDHNADAPTGDRFSVETGYVAGGGLRGANAVFDLIGTPAISDDGVVRHEPRGDSAAVPAAHDRFRRCTSSIAGHCTTPQASLAGSWAAQWALPVASGLPMDAHEGHLQHEPSTDNGSIGALLSGARVLQDVFGPLGEGEMAGLADVEPVPEILFLFEPAEYHAAASRRPTAARSRGASTMYSASTARCRQQIRIQVTTHHDSLFFRRSAPVRYLAKGPGRFTG